MSVIIGYPSGGAQQVSIKEYIAKLVEDGKTFYGDTNPFVYRLLGLAQSSKKIVVYASNPNYAYGGIFHYLDDDLKRSSGFSYICYNNPDNCGNAFDNIDWSASTWQFSGNDGEKDLVEFTLPNVERYALYIRANYLDYADNYCFLTKFNIYYRDASGAYVSGFSICPNLYASEYWFLTPESNMFKVTGLNNSANALRVQIWEIRLYKVDQAFPKIVTLNKLLNHVVFLSNDLFRVYEVDYIE